MKILALPLSILVFLMPVVTGLIAQESRLWFYISIPVLIVTGFLLVCLLGVPGKKIGKPVAVENEEIFDHLFINKKRNIYHQREQRYPKGATKIIF